MVYEIKVSSNYGRIWYIVYGEFIVKHRIDGPAVEIINGNKYWFNMGKKHRLDGPAVVRIENNQLQHRYYIDGYPQSYEVYQRINKKHE